MDSRTFSRYRSTLLTQPADRLYRAESQASGGFRVTSPSTFSIDFPDGRNVPYTVVVYKRQRIRYNSRQ